jgi:hypothetical protein
MRNLLSLGGIFKRSVCFFWKGTCLKETHTPLKMPPKKRRVTRAKPKTGAAGGKRRKRRVVRRRPAADGAGFFGDMWNKIKDVATHPSQILSIIPHPAAQTAAQVARALGRGRRGGSKMRTMPAEAWGVR